MRGRERRERKRDEGSIDADIQKRGEREKARNREETSEDKQKKEQGGRKEKRRERETDRSGREGQREEGRGRERERERERERGGRRRGRICVVDETTREKHRRTMKGGNTDTQSNQKGDSRRHIEERKQREIGTHCNTMNVDGERGNDGGRTKKRPRMPDGTCVRGGRLARSTWQARWRRLHSCLPS
jgi:hypothetical protein